MHFGMLNCEFNHHPHHRHSREGGNPASITGAAPKESGTPAFAGVTVGVWVDI